MRFLSRPLSSGSAHAVRSRNEAAIQRESAAMGIVNAAGIFLPVFLVRLGGTNLEVSLLTTLPAVTGFLLAIPIGTFLQARRNIVPWYTASRGVQFLVYGVTAIAVAIVPANLAVLTVLVLWGVFTLPSTAGAVAANAYLNDVAGPSGRYNLLSRRYAIMGLSTAITVAVAGQVLQAVRFALNYQLAFAVFSAAGLLVCWFSIQVIVPDHVRVEQSRGAGWRARLSGFLMLLRSQPPFLRFIARQFVLTFGLSVATPLIPLWYLREAHAPDAWIGIIGTVQSLALLAGYYTARRLARRRSTRLLFTATAVGIALYPAAMVLSRDLIVVALVIAYGAFVGAGLNLVLFDELLKTIPARHVVTFTAVQTSLSNLAAIIAPLLGGVLADMVGIGPGLLLAAALTLIGGALLLFARPAPAAS